jgi:hypothetical protein
VRRIAKQAAVLAAELRGALRAHCKQMNAKHRMRQVLLDLAFRPSDSPMAGVGSRSTPLRDIEGSVH